MDDNPATALSAQTFFNAFVKPAAHDCTPHIVDVNLSLQDIDAFMELHEVVTAGTGYVKPRTKQSVMKHLAKGHFAVAVYGQDGTMIAQALVALPDKDGATNTEGYPLAAKGTLKPETCAIIQSVGIHPDHRKCGLPAKLFAAAAHVAASAGRKHIIAKMNADNKPSFGAFARAGYKQHGLASAVNGEAYKSVFMIKPVGKTDITPALKGSKPC